MKKVVFFMISMPLDITKAARPDAGLP